MLHFNTKAFKIGKGPSRGAAVGAAHYEARHRLAGALHVNLTYGLVGEVK